MLTLYWEGYPQSLKKIWSRSHWDLCSWRQHWHTWYNPSRIWISTHLENVQTHRLSFYLLFMEIMEKLAELRVGDISLPLLPKVELHKVAVKVEGDLLMESCFREDPHKLIKANLNRRFVRIRKAKCVQNRPFHFRWCQTIGRQSCREHRAHRDFPQKPDGNNGCCEMSTYLSWMKHPYNSCLGCPQTHLELRKWDPAISALVQHPVNSLCIHQIQDIEHTSNT